MFLERESLSLNGLWLFLWSKQGSNFKSIGQLNTAGRRSFPCQLRETFEPDLRQNGFTENPFCGMNIAEAISHIRSERRFLAIEWNYGAIKGINHYLSGEPPFEAAQYRQWITKTYPHDFALVKELKRTDSETKKVRRGDAPRSSPRGDLAH